MSRSHALFGQLLTLRQKLTPRLALVVGLVAVLVAAGVARGTSVADRGRIHQGRPRRGRVSSSPPSESERSSMQRSALVFVAVCGALVLVLVAASHGPTKALPERDV